MSEQPLFSMEPTPFAAGDPVTVQTIWGDEPGTVVSVAEGMAQIDLARGDRIYISLARLHPRTEII